MKASHEFFEDILRLQGHLVHKARVADFVKGLVSAKAKALAILAQKDSAVVPLLFNDGAKLLAIDE